MLARLRAQREIPGNPRCKLLIPGTVFKTGKRLFLILKDQKGVKYFAPSAGFRQPVRTEMGVEFARPVGRVDDFVIGQEALIITVRHPTHTDIAKAKAAGKPAPLASAEEWILLEDYSALFEGR